MTKNFLMAMFVGLALALPTAAMASDGFYIGLNAGQSYFKDASGSMNNLAQVITMNCGACTYKLNMSNRELGYQGFAGYRFNEYFAVEGGYADFGKATSTAVGPYISGFPFTSPNVGTVHSEMKAHGATLDAMLGYPLTSRVLVFGKFGIIAAHGTNSFANSGMIGTGAATTSGNSTRLSYGAGIAYGLTSQWSVRGIWQQFHNIPAVGDINLISLGVTYSFR